jgi:hypothetical protein
MSTDLCLSTDLNAPTPTTTLLNHLKTHIANSTFSFLSYLPPARVPFFLAAGPSLHVTTSSPSTCDFFRNLFLSALPKTSDVIEETTEQSGIALLLRVNPSATDSFEEEANQGDWGITELLIYGAITHPSPPEAGTPPNSSPDASPPVVSVHALPLSSRHNFASYLSIKPEPHQEEPRYIAPNPQDVLNPIISRSTKKRRADALDRIVDRKMVKKQKASEARAALGGRNANTGPLSPRDELPDRTGSPEQRRRPSVVTTTLERTASSLSMSRRSSIALVSRPSTSASTKSLEKRVVKKEPEMVERSATENKNRDVLNKIVLEEMRRRGLKDYRKDRAKSIMPAGEDVLEVSVAEDDWKKREEEREEYKSVFHHTVKAAVFSLRRDGFTEDLVAADRMRHVVDRLLGVFLDDGKENAADVARDAIEGS